MTELTDKYNQLIYLIEKAKKSYHEYNESDGDEFNGLGAKHMHDMFDIFLFADNNKSIETKDASIPFKSDKLIGQPVILSFFESGNLNKCFIASVKFTDYGKVLYDIKIYPFKKDEIKNEETFTILKDVDSLFVKSEYENILDHE